MERAACRSRVERSLFWKMDGDVDEFLSLFFTKERSSKENVLCLVIGRSGKVSKVAFATKDLNAFVNGIVLPQKLNVQKLRHGVAVCQIASLLVLARLSSFDLSPIAISNIATRFIDAYFWCAVYFTNDPDVWVSTRNTAQFQRTCIILIFTQCVCVCFSEITFVRLSANFSTD